MSEKNELGGSILYQLFEELGSNVPKPDLVEVRDQIYAITDCAEKGLVLSCHDISDGGAAISIAEMTFGNNIGCSMKISSHLKEHQVLFSETGGFVLETAKDKTRKVIQVFEAYGLKTFLIGETGGERIQLNNTIDIKILEARDRWEQGLRDKL